MEVIANRPELIMKAVEGGLWAVYVPIETEVLGVKIEIPKGFITDFATVPRLPVVYLLFGNCIYFSAVVHDFLYTNHITTRLKADKVFLKLMENENVPEWRHHLMYAAVRVWGWWFWDKQHRLDHFINWHHFRRV